MTYRDDHGHFVSKQEDGKKCTHDFETGFRSVFEERGIKVKPKEDANADTDEKKLDDKYNEGLSIIEEEGFKDDGLSSSHRLLLSYAKGEISEEELVNGFREKQKPKNAEIPEDGSVYKEYNLEKDGIEEKLREEFDLSSVSKERVVDYIRDNFGVQNISDATEIANDILGKRDFSKDFYAEIENHKYFNKLKEKLNELKDLDYSDDKYGDIWYDKENLLISIENDLEKTFGKKIKRDTIEKYIKSKL